MKWSEMDARERDALVAEKVMGWEPSLLKHLRYHGDPKIRSRLPRFTTEIGPAWEVVKKMEAEGWGWTADRRSRAGEPFQYPFRFHRGTDIHRADCADVRESICLAALRAKGVEV